MLHKGAWVAVLLGPPGYPKLCKKIHDHMRIMGIQSVYSHKKITKSGEIGNHGITGIFFAAGIVRIVRMMKYEKSQMSLDSLSSTSRFCIFLFYSHILTLERKARFLDYISAVNPFTVTNWRSFAFSQYQQNDMRLSGIGAAKDWPPSNNCFW